MADDFGDPGREDDRDIDLERILARWGLSDPTRSSPRGNLDLDAGSTTPGTSDSEKGSGVPEDLNLEPNSTVTGDGDGSSQREPFRVPRPAVAGARQTKTQRRPGPHSSTSSRRSPSARGVGPDDRETTGHPRSRRRLFGVRPLFVGVLGIASAVMVVSAVAATRAESAASALPASLVDIGKSPGAQGEVGPGGLSGCGVTSAESTGATASSRPTAPGFSRPTAAAGAPAVLRNDAYWLGVMRGLDDKRMSTFVAGGVGEIASFDADDGPAARIDTRTLCQLRSAGVRPRGLRTVLLGVHVLSQTTTRVVLNVSDTRSAYDLVRDATTTLVSSESALVVDRGTAASSAVVVAHQSSRGQTRWLVELSWNGKEWVIRHTAQVT